MHISKSCMYSNVQWHFITYYVPFITNHFVLYTLYFSIPVFSQYTYLLMKKVYNFILNTNLFHYRIITFNKLLSHYSTDYELYYSDDFFSLKNVWTKIWLTSLLLINLSRFILILLIILFCYVKLVSNILQFGTMNLTLHRIVLRVFFYQLVLITFCTIFYYILNLSLYQNKKNSLPQKTFCITLCDLYCNRL